MADRTPESGCYEFRPLELVPDKIRPYLPERWDIETNEEGWRISDYQDALWVEIKENRNGEGNTVGILDKARGTAETTLYNTGLVCARYVAGRAGAYHLEFFGRNSICDITMNSETNPLQPRYEILVSGLPRPLRFPLSTGGLPFHESLVRPLASHTTRISIP